MNIIEQVKERLSLFINLYDVLRIIDPIKKRTIIIKENDIHESEEACYVFWKAGNSCVNCISMRAYVENDTFIKIENKEEKIYLIIATPIILDNNKYIVEILKDISQNGKIITKTNNSDNFVEHILSDMNEKIIKDELTGIYNKRYINEKLPVEISNSIIKQNPLSVIMVDIDFFKGVNDSYGHLTGDKILRDFVKLITSSIRKNTDWVGRYGGEEFLIVLNNTDLDNAYKIAEEVRKLVEGTTFEYGGIKIRITASFGVHGIVNNKVSVEELILNADKNLYKAKINGRNKTVVS